MSDWPPQPPEGAKPNFPDPDAAEWRYQRYKYDQYQAGKQQEEILSFDTWKERHFNPAALGRRPGRPGSSVLRVFCQSPQLLPSNEITDFIRDGWYFDEPPKME